MTKYLDYDGLKKFKEQADAAYLPAKGTIPLTGSVNLTTETALSLAAKYAKVANNSLNFYVIADSSGKLPSSETRININSSITSLVGAEGANVGDIFVVGKLDLKPVYKVIPLNDAKAENSDYKGTQGVVTPWDKAQINKVPNMESAISAAKNNLPTYSESNMNNALKTGFYPWCTLGRPSGSTGAYTLVTLASTTADNNGYTTIEQTAYGRQNDELGKIFKRIIFKPNSGDTEYGEWKEITNDNIIANSLDIPFTPGNALAMTLKLKRTNYGYGVPYNDVVYNLDMWNAYGYKDNERNSPYPFSGMCFTEYGTGMYTFIDYRREGSGNGIIRVQAIGGSNAHAAMGYYNPDNNEELINGLGADANEPYIVRSGKKFKIDFDKAVELGVLKKSGGASKNIKPRIVAKKAISINSVITGPNPCFYIRKDLRLRGLKRNQEYRIFVNGSIMEVNKDNRGITDNSDHYSVVEITYGGESVYKLFHVDNIVADGDVIDINIVAEDIQQQTVRSTDGNWVYHNNSLYYIGRVPILGTIINKNLCMKEIKSKKRAFAVFGLRNRTKISKQGSYAGLLRNHKNWARGATDSNIQKMAFYKRGVEVASRIIMYKGDKAANRKRQKPLLM